VLDVDLVLLGELFEDGTGALLEEGEVGGDDVLGGAGSTSFWNMISCLMSLRMEKPASDLRLLNSSFSMKPS
jgi:hypothetical protein